MMGRAQRLGAIWALCWLLGNTLAHGADLQLFQDSFNAPGAEVPWYGAPWNAIAEGSTPEGDNTVYQTTANTYQGAVSDLQTGMTGNFPYHIQAMVKLESVPGGWSTTAIGWQLENADADKFRIDIPHHAPGLIQVYRIFEGQATQLGDNLDISSLGATTGDWLRIGMTVGIRHVQVNVERWEGNGWSSPVVSPIYQDRMLDRKTAWRVSLEGFSDVAALHTVDQVTLTDLDYNQPVSMSFDQGWMVLDDGGTPLTQNRVGHYAMDLNVDDVWMFGAEAPTITPQDLGGGVWEITYAVSAGTLVERIEPFTAYGPNGWLRSATYTNNSGATQDLLEVQFRLGAKMDSGLGQWLPRHFWLGEPVAGRNVGVGYLTSGDNYAHYYDEGNGQVTTAAYANWRLAPGQSAPVGQQAIWIGSAAVAGFREEAQRWYMAADITPDPAIPAWVYEMIMYNGGGNGHIDSLFSDVGGFDHFSRQIDYLYDLGVSTIWINSVHEHKVGPDPFSGNWNQYHQKDLKIDPILGGASKFTDLVGAFQDKGIHVIGETVPHGGDTPERLSLSNWWMTDRSGNTVIPYVTPVMDYACPDWRSALATAMEDQATNAGIEGVRIDVAEGFGSNWGSPATNHASASAITAMMDLIEALRDVIALGPNPIPVIMPESTVDRPEFFGLDGAAGISIGFDTEQLWAHIHDLTDAVGMVTTFTDFFENERGSLPDGSIVRRALGNINPVVEYGRLQYRFGTGLARALYGVSLSVPGIPMMYQEEELGNYDGLRQLNWARRGIPELTYGDADYTGISYDPRAFCVLRSWQGRHAVGLANLSGETITGTVNLPAALASLAGATVYDGVSGQTVTMGAGSFDWTLEPYGVALLRLENAPTLSAPAESWAGEADSQPVTPTGFTMSVDDDGIQIQNGSLVLAIRGGAGTWEEVSNDGTIATYSSCDGTLSVEDLGSAYEIAFDLAEHAVNTPPVVSIYNSDRWYVSGKTALLGDRTLRRHFPFAESAGYTWKRNQVWGAVPGGEFYDNVAPTGRYWQSLWEPLNPTAPAVAFEDSEGNGLVLSQILTNAENVVLTDRTDEELVEPYRLDLRFYAQDPDLTAGIHQFGVGQPWELSEHSDEPVAPASLTFRVEVSSGAIEEELDAPRETFGRGEAEVVRSGNDSDYWDGNGAIYYINPNTVTWSNLQGIDGTYRIALRLRHSEIGPSQTELTGDYTVRFNNILQPLEWVEYNVYSTGNSWFGTALTPSIDLSGGPHFMSVTTQNHWRAVGTQFELIPVETDNVSFLERFPGSGLENNWNGDVWHEATDASSPTRDDSVGESDSNTWQLTTSELFQPPLSAYPVSLRGMIKLGTPPGASEWITTRMGFAFANGDRYWVDVPGHAPGLVQLYREQASTPVLIDGNIDISSLGAVAGNWLWLTLCLDTDGLDLSVQQWDGTGWSQSIDSMFYEDVVIDRNQGWAVMLEALSSLPAQHHVDQIELLPYRAIGTPLADVVMIDTSLLGASFWSFDTTRASTAMVDGLFQATSGYGPPSGYYPLLGDFDGDAIAERLLVDTTNRYWHWDRSSNEAGGGWGDSGTESADYFYYTNAEPLVSDINGDGRDDRVGFNAGEWRCTFSENGGAGSGTAASMSGTQNWGDGSELAACLGDFNADGLADRVLASEVAGSLEWDIDFQAATTTWGDGIADATLTFGKTGDTRRHQWRRPGRVSTQPPQCRRPTADCRLFAGLPSQRLYWLWFVFAYPPAGPHGWPLRYPSRDLRG